LAAKLFSLLDSLQMVTKPNLKVLDFAERLDSLKSKNAIWEAFVSFVAPYGFQYAGYVDLPGPGERLQDAMVCNSPLTDWFRHYLRNNYIVNDPIVLHRSKTALPYTMDEVLACPDYGASQKRILHELMEFGIKATINIPLRSPRNGLAMIGLASKNSGLSPDQRADLVLGALSTSLRLRPPFPDGAPLPHLTDRERECLQLVALGRSDQEIGEALKISEKTVNFHIESAKRKYAVSSRTSAAVMAAKAGVIRV
jgi:DNA-binding CsgD family transcriptional regulator